MEHPNTYLHVRCNQRTSTSNTEAEKLAGKPQPIPCIGCGHAVPSWECVWVAIDGRVTQDRLSQESVPEPLTEAQLEAIEDGDFDDEIGEEPPPRPRGSISPSVNEGPFL